MSIGPGRGELYVFEGPDGVGKTTLAWALAGKLGSAGHPCEYFSFPGRAPGTLGRLVYELHHDPGKLGVGAVAPVSLQLMHVAAHLDAIGRHILPVLEAGRSVVLDRFWWSTLVYGIVSGVECEHLDAMLGLERRVWGDTLPTVAFLVSRPTPLREEGPTEWWRGLRDAYERLAREQVGRYPMETVVNDGPVSVALEKMLRAVEGVRAARG